MNQRAQAACGDDDLSEKRRDRGADHALRRHEREIRDDIGDEGKQCAISRYECWPSQRSPDA